LSGWFQIQKRIQNLFENGFGKLEKEKEKEILFYSTFWPNSAHARFFCTRPTCPLSRVARLPSLCFPLWAELPLA
jgi:hypothetical protein